MGYGIKVSQAGYPVDTAADNQLLFSSSFHSSMYIQSGTLAGGASFNHNLGYNPVYFFNSPDFGYYLGGYSFDTHLISIGTGTLYNDLSHTIQYYILPIDLRTPITAQNIITTASTQGTTSQNYGFKISTTGVDVGTASLNDLTIFSGITQAGFGVRQQTIHQSGYTDSLSNGGTATYSHNLGYEPMFLTYVKGHPNQVHSGYSCDMIYFDPLSYAIQLQSSITSSQLSIVNNLGNSVDVAYVIFKDPVI